MKHSFATLQMHFSEVLQDRKDNYLCIFGWLPIKHTCNGNARCHLSSHKHIYVSQQEMSYIQSQICIFIHRMPAVMKVLEPLVSNCQSQYTSGCHSLLFLGGNSIACYVDITTYSIQLLERRTLAPQWFTRDSSPREGRHTKCSEPEFKI